MLAGDDRSAWDASLLTDERVIEFWDSERVLGKWLPQQDDYSDLIFGPLAWDIFFLYGPEAVWDGTPAPLISSGSTIISSRDYLKESIGPLLSTN